METSTYKKFRNKKLSRIHGETAWSSKEALLRVAKEVALDCDVHYDWSGEFGLLATILGPVWYLTEVALNYVVDDLARCWVPYGFPATYRPMARAHHCVAIAYPLPII